MFDKQRNRVLGELDLAHQSFYHTEIFGGPSLHFHLKSLDAAKERDLDRVAESVYAVLTAWGMHRMGPGGSKMCEFGKFRASLQAVWPIVIPLQIKTPDTLTESDWSSLQGVFSEVCCMASKSSLVGNSKVMAHLLPNLVPPVDREYTLKFLFGRGNITNGIDLEWGKLRMVLEGFFYPVSQSPIFQLKAEEWLLQRDRYKWDTSSLKIVDNLVIGLSKMSRADQPSSKILAEVAMS
jgi:hypothetical protein